MHCCKDKYRWTDEQQFGSIQLHDQPDTHFFPEHLLEETLLYSDLF